MTNDAFAFANFTPAPDPNHVYFNVSRFKPKLAISDIAAAVRTKWRGFKWFVSGDRKDDRIVTGYIRRIYREYEIKRNFSVDLIGVLRSFYCNEILHAIKYKCFRKYIKYVHDTVAISNQGN